LYHSTLGLRAFHRTCIESNKEEKKKHLLSGFGLSSQPPPYPANRRPILPTAALSSQPPPYPANRRPILPTTALSCQPPPYPANRRPILPTAALSCKPPPYPANRRPIWQVTRTTMRTFDTFCTARRRIQNGCRARSRMTLKKVEGLGFRV
jgi:hypothetical protein